MSTSSPTTYDVADAAFWKNPYEQYAAMRRDAPLVRIDPGGIWAATRYDTVMEVLARPEVFSSAGLQAIMQPAWLEDNPLARSLLVKDPPEHTVLRSIVRNVFTPRRIASYEPALRAKVDQLLDSAGGRSLDFVADLGLPVPATMAGWLLGLDPEHALRYKRWSDAIAEIGLVAPDDVERQQHIIGLLREMDAFVGEVLDDRFTTERDDLVGTLIRSETDGRRLTREEVRCFLFLLLAAGLETTVGAIGGAGFMLSERPDVHARLRADRSLVPAFVDEVLRYLGPVHGTYRVVSRDTTLGGADLPSGSFVLLLMASASRDDACVPDGDSFNIDRPRTNSLNFPFGHGIHFCLGAALARLEAQVVVEAVVDRYERLDRVPDALEWNNSVQTRGLRRLELSAG